MTVLQLLLSDPFQVVEHGQTFANGACGGISGMPLRGHLAVLALRQLFGALLGLLMELRLHRAQRTDELI